MEYISIHALVKRATYQLPARLRGAGISIHALVKRATVFTKAQYNIDNISIHALVKRATTHKCDQRSQDFYFNPRPRKEGDTNT